MKSNTAKYYAKNPEARKKRLEYQKEYNKQRKEVVRRNDLKKANRQMGSKGDGLDVSHKKGGGVTLEGASSNRARNGMVKGKSKSYRVNTKK